MLIENLPFLESYLLIPILGLFCLYFLSCLIVHLYRSLKKIKPMLSSLFAVFISFLSISIFYIIYELGQCSPPSHLIALNSLECVGGKISISIINQEKFTLS
jgi:hypothetical protein